MIIENKLLITGGISGLDRNIKNTNIILVKTLIVLIQLVR